MKHHIRLNIRTCMVLYSLFEENHRRNKTVKKTENKPIGYIVGYICKHNKMLLHDLTRNLTCNNKVLVV